MHDIITFCCKFFSDVSNPRGFAIDWISGNMYFSSSNSDSGSGTSISVAKLNGVYRTEILTHGQMGNDKSPVEIQNLSSLAVHPVKG